MVCAYLEIFEAGVVVGCDVGLGGHWVGRGEARLCTTCNTVHSLSHWE